MDHIVRHDNTIPHDNIQVSGRPWKLKEGVRVRLEVGRANKHDFSLTFHFEVLKGKGERLHFPKLLEGPYDGNASFSFDFLFLCASTPQPYETLLCTALCNRMSIVLAVSTQTRICCFAGNKIIDSTLPAEQSKALERFFEPARS